MKQELIYIIDNIEHIICKIHAEKAEIKIVAGGIHINSCCEKHKRFLERQIDYELYKLFNKEEEEAEEVVSPLKYAV